MALEKSDGFVFFPGGRHQFRFEEDGRAVLRVDFQRALQQLYGFFLFAAIEQPLRVVQIGKGRFLLLAHHVVQLGQPHLDAQVFGFYVEQPVQYLHGFLGVVRFQVRFRCASAICRKRGRASLNTPC